MYRAFVCEEAPPPTRNTKPPAWRSSYQGSSQTPVICWKHNCIDIIVLCHACPHYWVKITACFASTLHCYVVFVNTTVTEHSSRAYRHRTWLLLFAERRDLAWRRHLTCIPNYVGVSLAFEYHYYTTAIGKRKKKMKAYVGSRGIAPLFLRPGIRWRRVHYCITIITRFIVLCVSFFVIYFLPPITASDVFITLNAFLHLHIIIYIYRLYLLYYIIDYIIKTPVPVAARSKA
jgi:hypothetical protein